MEKVLQPDSWTWCYAMGRTGLYLHRRRTDMEFRAYVCGVVARARAERQEASRDVP